MREAALLSFRLSPHGPEFDTPEQKKALVDALTQLLTCLDVAEAERLYWQIDNFIVVQGSRGPDTHLLFEPLLNAVARASGIGRTKLLEVSHQLFFSGRQSRFSHDGEAHEREHLQGVLLKYRHLLGELARGGSSEEQELAAHLLNA